MSFREWAFHPIKTYRTNKWCEKAFEANLKETGHLFPEEICHPPGIESVTSSSQITYMIDKFTADLTDLDREYQSLEPRLRRLNKKRRSLELYLGWLQRKKNKLVRIATET